MSTPRRISTVSSSGAVVLRSSCDACTEVKMACSRGKPTCARCARRGEVCIYGPMKRPGRKKHNPPQQQSVPEDVIRVHPPPSLAKDDSRTSREPAEILQSHANFSPDLPMRDPEALPAPTGSFTLLPMPSERPEIDQNGQTGTAWSSSEEDGNTSTNASAPAIDLGTFTPPDIDFMSAFDDPNWMLWSPAFPSGEPDGYAPPSNSASLPNGFVSHTGSIHNLFNISQSGDNCLALALRILGALMPPIEACPAQKNIRHDSVGTNVETFTSTDNNGFDKAMQRNLESIEFLSLILKCPCAMNSSVVLILAHIVFQILAWYAAAAGVPSKATCLPLGNRIHLPQLPAPVTSPVAARYNVEDEGTRDRIICQTVLSKMHSVRTLVEGLSQILLCNGEQAVHSHSEGRDMQGSLSLDPVPPSALAISLESELRLCLRDTSRAIVAKLAEI